MIPRIALIAITFLFTGCEVMKDASLSYVTDVGGKDVVATWNSGKLGVMVDGRSAK